MRPTTLNEYLAKSEDEKKGGKATGFKAWMEKIAKMKKSLVEKP